MNNDLSVSLYKKIEEMDEPRIYKQWHASSIYKCPLEQYLLRKGQPITNKPTSALRLRWQVGHKMEEAIRPYLEALYPDIKSNVRLTSEKLDMTGEYDNLVGIELFEVKSVHPFAFKHLEKERKPHYHYELQQHAYVLLLAEQGVEVTKINYIYLSLDGRVMCFTTDVQDELLDNIKARLRALNDAWRAQKPPECICLMKGHPLEKAAHQYCNYKDAYECCVIKSQVTKTSNETLEIKPEILTHPNIPKPLHEINPRNIMGKEKWDVLRQEVYKKTNYHCIACGVSKKDAKKHQWLEAHEYYDIDYSKGIVTIKDIYPLCHYCHNFIHSGRLKMILGKDKSVEEVREILEHGFKVLSENNLQCFPFTGDLAEEVEANCYDVSAYEMPDSGVEWSDWKLIWQGKEYKSKFADINEWTQHFKRSNNG